MQIGKQQRQRSYKDLQKSEGFNQQGKEKEYLPALLFNSEEEDLIKKKEISD